MNARQTSTGDLVLSLSEYSILCRWVYEQTGMAFDHKHLDLVTNRVRRRLAQKPGLTVHTYLERLQEDVTEAAEFLDQLTVNETYFFRDLSQMDTLRQLLAVIVPEKARQPNGWLRVWSAACSIGAEPFTVAMLIQEELERCQVTLEWQIVATDISNSALQVAETALYSDREVRDVPRHLFDKYFRQNGDWWQFYHPCRDQVRFHYSNLLNPGVEVQGSFDIVLCRNVLIYFDDASRRQVADILFDRMVPGGYLLLGASESMSRISRAFHLRRIGTGFVYVRP